MVDITNNVVDITNYVVDTTNEKGSTSTMEQQPISRRCLVTGAARGAFAVAAAAGTTALWPLVASASATWCEDDPLLTLVTPDGLHVHVYLTLSARGTEFLPDLQAGGKSATFTAKHVERDDHVATRFDVTVVVPNDPHYGEFHYRACLSSEPGGKGHIYDQDRHCKSGEPTVLRMTVPHA